VLNEGAAGVDWGVGAKWRQWSLGAGQAPGHSAGKGPVHRQVQWLPTTLAPDSTTVMLHKLLGMQMLPGPAHSPFAGNGQNAWPV
jgi:hypothetical protein